STPLFWSLFQTPSAVTKIRTLLEDKPEYIGLKVGVRTRGCNGMTYTLDFTKQKDQADEEVLQDGEQTPLSQTTLSGGGGDTM
uniref:Iron-sulfur cluster assembly 1 n=1 Tax=Hucho hucho TaxID=62062 RepID=A0A4W5JRE9_9TELE